jgi:hypothetical protein
MKDGMIDSARLSSSGNDNFVAASPKLRIDKMLPARGSRSFVEIETPAAK